MKPVYLFLFAFCCSLCHAQSVRYVAPFFGNEDPENSYYLQVFKRSLALAEAEFGVVELEPINVPMLQGRQFRSLENDQIDVMWSMTSRERENRARAIRIPLTMGLIGYRVLVIKESDKSKFAALSTSEQLKKETALLGHDWPDIEIMKANGFLVEAVSWHNSMYSLLGGKQFDYFPRGILEIGQELSFFNQGGHFILEDKWLLKYPAAMYFFVHKDNEKLAQRLEAGLTKMLESGELRSMLLTHPSHHQGLQILNLQSRTMVNLDNPLLPDQTPTLIPNYWLSLDDLLQNTY
ncbi:hypothetical protein [Pseudoalteromonas pernae]|uniref:hypothetical protein n=1 Tax=Pseudoalteromonas pernae TaxID=3118054 RepID=UPI003242150A